MTDLDDAPESLDFRSGPEDEFVKVLKPGSTLHPPEPMIPYLRKVDRELEGKEVFGIYVKTRTTQHPMLKKGFIKHEFSELPEDSWFDKAQEKKLGLPLQNSGEVYETRQITKDTDSKTSVLKDYSEKDSRELQKKVQNQNQTLNIDESKSSYHWRDDENIYTQNKNNKKNTSLHNKHHKIGYNHLLQINQTRQDPTTPTHINTILNQPTLVANILSNDTQNTITSDPRRQFSNYNMKPLYNKSANEIRGKQNTTNNSSNTLLEPKSEQNISGDAKNLHQSLHLELPSNYSQQSQPKQEQSPLKANNALNNNSFAEIVGKQNTSGSYSNILNNRSTVQHFQPFQQNPSNQKETTICSTDNDVYNKHVNEITNIQNNNISDPNSHHRSRRMEQPFRSFKQVPPKQEENIIPQEKSNLYNKSIDGFISKQLNTGNDPNALRSSRRLERPFQLYQEIPPNENSSVNKNGVNGFINKQTNTGTISDPNRLHSSRRMEYPFQLHRQTPPNANSSLNKNGVNGFINKQNNTINDPNGFRSSRRMEQPFHPYRQIPPTQDQTTLRHADNDVYYNKRVSENISKQNNTISDPNNFHHSRRMEQTFHSYRKNSPKQDQTRVPYGNNSLNNKNVDAFTNEQKVTISDPNILHSSGRMKPSFNSDVQHLPKQEQTTIRYADNDVYNNRVNEITNKPNNTISYPNSLRSSRPMDQPFHSYRKNTAQQEQKTSNDANSSQNNNSVDGFTNKQNNSISDPKSIYSSRRIERPFHSYRQNPPIQEQTAVPHENNTLNNKSKDGFISKQNNTISDLNTLHSSRRTEQPFHSYRQNPAPQDQTRLYDSNSYHNNNSVDGFTNKQSNTISDPKGIYSSRRIERPFHSYRENPLTQEQTAVPRENNTLNNKSKDGFISKQNNTISDLNTLHSSRRTEQPFHSYRQNPAQQEQTTLNDANRSQNNNSFDGFTNKQNNTISYPKSIYSSRRIERPFHSYRENPPTQEQTAVPRENNTLNNKSKDGFISKQNNTISDLNTLRNSRPMEQPFNSYRQYSPKQHQTTVRHGINTLNNNSVDEFTNKQNNIISNPNSLYSIRPMQQPFHPYRNIPLKLEKTTVRLADNDVFNKRVSEITSKQNPTISDPNSLNSSRSVQQPYPPYRKIPPKQEQTTVRLADNDVYNNRVGEIRSKQNTTISDPISLHGSLRMEQPLHSYRQNTSKKEQTTKTIINTDNVLQNKQFTNIEGKTSISSRDPNSHHIDKQLSWQQNKIKHYQTNNSQNGNTFHTNTPINKTDSASAESRDIHVVHNNSSSERVALLAQHYNRKPIIKNATKSNLKCQVIDPDLVPITTTGDQNSPLYKYHVKRERMMVPSSVPRSRPEQESMIRGSNSRASGVSNVNEPEGLEGSIIEDQLSTGIIPSSQTGSNFTHGNLDTIGRRLNQPEHEALVSDNQPKGNYSEDSENRNQPNVLIAAYLKYIEDMKSKIKQIAKDQSIVRSAEIKMDIGEKNMPERNDVNTKVTENNLYSIEKRYGKSSTENINERKGYHQKQMDQTVISSKNPINSHHVSGEQADILKSESHLGPDTTPADDESKVNHDRSINNTNLPNNSATHYEKSNQFPTTWYSKLPWTPSYFTGRAGYNWPTVQRSLLTEGDEADHPDQLGDAKPRVPYGEYIEKLKFAFKRYLKYIGKKLTKYQEERENTLPDNPSDLELLRFAFIRYKNKLLKKVSNVSDDGNNNSSTSKELKRVKSRKTDD